jgi:hypothetical protein
MLLAMGVAFTQIKKFIVLIGFWQISGLKIYFSTYLIEAPYNTIPQGLDGKDRFCSVFDPW